MTAPLWERIPHDTLHVAVARTRRFPQSWRWCVTGTAGEARGTTRTRHQAITTALLMAHPPSMYHQTPPSTARPAQPGDLPIVYLEWVDSAGISEWGDADQHQALRPHRIRTTGFLLTDTPDHVTVVQSCADPDGGTGDVQYDHAIAIPTQAITHRVDLPTRPPEKYVNTPTNCPQCQPADNNTRRDR